jgi:hypothetical protein
VLLNLVPRDYPTEGSSVVVRPSVKD